MECVMGVVGHDFAVYSLARPQISLPATRDLAAGVSGRPPAAAAAMEDTGDLPRAPNAPAELPPPLPGAVAAKPKAQRCLGLAPPPRPVAAASTAVPGTSNGKVKVDTVPHASAAPSGRQRKQPRDPSAPAPPKRAVAKKAPPASARLPAASLQPYPATASSMEPLPASTTWMEHGASSPATVATGALVVLDGMPTRQMRNMDSAMKSRERKKSYVKDLETKNKYLDAECRRLSYALQCCVAENMALRQSMLKDRPVGAPTATQESAVLTGKMQLTEQIISC